MVLARGHQGPRLYAARVANPTEGIEYELIEHRLTDEHIRIYDSYAGGCFRSFK